MEIDDSLYSRQRYMLGDQAMRALAKSRVLLCGCGSVGIEIAKNIVLAGVKKVAIADDTLVGEEDVGNNFYVTSSDVIQTKLRSSVVASRLAELNPYVDIVVVPERIVDLNCTDVLANLSDYDCIVMTECSVDACMQMNDFCRSQSPPIKFICSDAHGTLARVFCDFGPSFVVYDKDGEVPKEAFIKSITQNSRGVVTILDDQRHGFEDGDCVAFKEIQGMTELNGKMHEIKVISPCSFAIGDTSDYSCYVRNGIVTQVKALPKSIQFRSLSDQLQEPSILDVGYGSSIDSKLLHVTFRALQHYRKLHGRMPRKDVECVEVIGRASSINTDINLDESELIFKLAKASSGCLPPLCAAIGGITAQEVLKSLTGKYTPIRQWLYLDAIKLLPTEGVGILEEEYVKCAGRYKQLCVCLGMKMLKKLRRLNAFMVGCGAIGCEMLKNMALLGIATEKEHSKEPKVVVTDHDLIEKSNLNRQFLFRNHHLQQSKSKVAADSAKLINPEMKIVALDKKVCKETEETFRDSFFQEQDIVINALDNIEARLYMDSRCVSNFRPLIETGTSGPKGHVQVIVPGLTESYASKIDPPEEMVPYCTLKSFPMQPTHTMLWAKFKFEVFSEKPFQFNQFWSKVKGDCPDDCDFLLHLANNIELYKAEAYTAVMATLRQPRTWRDCISKARCTFDKYFNNSPRQLLHNFPLDCKTKDGSLFWSSPKRPPTPLTFDPSDSIHMMFIMSYAHVMCSVHGITIPSNASESHHKELSEGLHNAEVPHFEPSSKFINTDENVQKPEKSVPSYSDCNLDDLKSCINLLMKEADKRFMLSPQVFEKDDDANGHVDLITATSNLRSIVYGLPVADRLEVKRIAGRIIPAIATTTSAIAGLATLQLLQVIKWKLNNELHETDEVKGHVNHGIEQFRNAFVNTAIPLLLLSEPGPAERLTIRDDLSFTLWDRWEVKGSTTFKLEDFIEYFKTNLNLVVSTVIHRNKLMYFSILNPHKKRLGQLMTDLIGNTSECYVDLDVTFENEDGMDDDLSAPTIRYHLC